MAMDFRIGDRVVKDPAGWRPAECDPPGAGDGIGTVTEVLMNRFGIAPDYVIVSWPRRPGECWCRSEELAPAPGQSAD